MELKEQHLELHQYLDFLKRKEEDYICLSVQEKTSGTGSPQKLSPLLQGGPDRHYTGTTLWTFPNTAKALVLFKHVLSSEGKHVLKKIFILSYKVIRNVSLKRPPDLSVTGSG